MKMGIFDFDTDLNFAWKHGGPCSCNGKKWKAANFWSKNSRGAKNSFFNLLPLTSFSLSLSLSLSTSLSSSPHLSHTLSLFTEIKALMFLCILGGRTLFNENRKEIRNDQDSVDFVDVVVIVAVVAAVVGVAVAIHVAAVVVVVVVVVAATTEFLLTI